MVPGFLIPEMTVQDPGAGPAIDVSSAAGRTLLLTLGITRSVEQESLDVAVWGSSDAHDWGKHPLVTFPQKFYCGTYSLLVDLSRNPDIRYLRAQWKMNRWGRGSLKPLFGFYIFVAAHATEPHAALAAKATS